MFIDGATFKVLIGLAMILASVCIFVWLWKYLCKIPVKRYGKHFGLVAFAVVCVLFGSDKSPLADVIFYQTDPEIAWLKDTGSYVSNDVVHVSFQPHAQLPNDAILQMWNCPTNSVEDHSAWAQYGADVTLADCPREFDIAYSNAMEYSWLFMTTYTRPTQVVTNGVLHMNYIRAHKAEEENADTIIGVPIHTGIAINDEQRGINSKPYYCEVEYLESTGTQWIDTGVPCGGDITFDLSVYTQVAGSMLFGASQAYQTNGLYAFNGRNNALYGNYWNSEFFMLQATDTISKWLSISKTSNTWKVNGVIVKTNPPNTFSSGETFALFCRKQNGAPFGMKSGVRFASCKLFNGNGVLVRDFIPVLDREMRPAMYDRVTGKLFYNKGTGEFKTNLNLNLLETLSEE